MSDNLYSRNQDLDIWKIDTNPNESHNSLNYRRRVEFDVKEGFGDISRMNAPNASNTNINGNSFNNDLANSEPKLRIANAITSTINLLTDHLITHPFIVIRRQTQVNRKSGSYHLTPLTIIPFVIRIQRKQGFAVLWKGVGSVLITKGILISFEALIAEVTPFPRDISSQRLTIEKVLQHLVLKGVAFLLITPFLCSSCIETVQSSIASENPGVFDSIKEGFSRISHWKMDRKLPIWLLCGPTVTYHLSHYVIYSLVRNFSLSINKQNMTSGTENVNNWKHQYKEIIGSFWGHFVADIVLFPLQTIILRLYLQGTRTIIDNCDPSSAVTPIISDYDSTSDCYSTIVKEEGTFGLFKGFGALVLQYTIHYSVLKLTKYFVEKTISNLPQSDRH